MAKLAVLILTFNEEKNIEACIESAGFADEIVVVDSGSTDNTVELAKAAGAKVHIHPFAGFDVQRNVALEQTNADWVFYLDADERIDAEAANAIRAAAESNKQVFYDIKRVNIVFGQRMKYGDHGPDYPRRMFPQNQVHWEGVVHEGAKCALPMERLAGFLDHYTYTDWDRYFVKFNQYTSLMAEKMYEKGKRATFAGMLGHTIFAFIRFYILHRGFLDGKMGFIFAVNHLYYTMIKYVKLHHMQQKEKD